MPRWLSPSKQNVLKALLQGSLLLPYHAAAVTAARAQQSGSFRFGSAHSSKSVLSSAVVECINAVRKQLGPNSAPHLCQLLVTPEQHGSNIEYAPAFVRECFSDREWQPPVVIGGAVQGLLTGNDSNVAGVSLFAAHMPGVELMPFHVTTTSLPQLTAEHWNMLMQSSLAEQDKQHQTAALLLSEPYFIQIEELIRRIQGALPDCPLVGGVLQPEAWGNNPWGGKRSLRGALFMNNKVLDEGAVGCFMKGPLQMEVVCGQGCRAVGQAATVTSSEGSSILELDHQTALLVVRQMFQSLSAKDKQLQIQMGLDTSGTGQAFVARDIAGYTPANQSVQVMAEVPEGSKVQLHVQDSELAFQHLQTQLQGCAERITPSLLSSPQQLGSLLYSCVTASSSPQSLFSSALPNVTLQGGQFQGEFGPTVHGNPKHSFLQSYSNSFGLIRQTS